MGELHALPGTSIFQMMFCEGPQASGSDGLSAATPPSSPRNPGQLSSSGGTTNPSAAKHRTVATRNCSLVMMAQSSCTRDGNFVNATMTAATASGYPDD